MRIVSDFLYLIRIIIFGSFIIIYLNYIGGTEWDTYSTSLVSDKERARENDSSPSMVKSMYDESQPEPIVEPETENKTTFHGDDLPKKYGSVYRLDGSRQFKNHYDRLSKHNRGVCGKWFPQEKRREADNLAIFDSIANYLEFPRYQHMVARQEFSRIPLRDWSSPNGIDVIITSIIVCAVIGLKDPRFGREYNPDRKDESQDDLFLKLIMSLSYKDSVVRSCYQKVLRHVEWEPVNWC